MHRRTILLCAFVLWGTFARWYPDSQRYFPISTHETLAACVAHSRNMWGNPKCLPHTINPNHR